MLPWDPLWRLRHVGYPVSPRGYRGLPAFASLSMAGSERALPLQRLVPLLLNFRKGTNRDELEQFFGLFTKSGG